MDVHVGAKCPCLKEKVTFSYKEGRCRDASILHITKHSWELFIVRRPRDGRDWPVMMPFYQHTVRRKISVMESWGIGPQTVYVLKLTCADVLSCGQFCGHCISVSACVTVRYWPEGRAREWDDYKMMCEIFGVLCFITSCRISCSKYLLYS